MADLLIRSIQLGKPMVWPPLLLTRFPVESGHDGSRWRRLEVGFTFPRPGRTREFRDLDPRGTFGLQIGQQPVGEHASLADVKLRWWSRQLDGSSAPLEAVRHSLERPAKQLLGSADQRADEAVNEVVGALLDTLARVEAGATDEGLSERVLYGMHYHDPIHTLWLLREMYLAAGWPLEYVLPDLRSWLYTWGHNNAEVEPRELRNMLAAIDAQLQRERPGG